MPGTQCQAREFSVTNVEEASQVATSLTNLTFLGNAPGLADAVWTFYRVGAGATAYLLRHYRLGIDVWRLAHRDARRAAAASRCRKHRSKAGRLRLHTDWRHQSSHRHRGQHQPGDPSGPIR